MKFFVDNCLPRRLAEALDLLETNSVAVKHLQSEFPGDTKDVDWLPWVARNSYALITSDHAILKNVTERELVDGLSIHMYVTPKKLPQRGVWQQAAWLVRLWPTIKAHAEGA